MAVTTDILRTWRDPRAVMRKILAQGKREDRAVAFLYLSCLLIFVGQWPSMARQSAGFDVAPGTEGFDISTRLTYGAFTWLIIAPLLFYGLAAASHLMAKVLGGKGDHFGARMALFWSLLATIPALLLYGLTVGFIGSGMQANLTGGLWVAAFGWIWLQSLREAEAP